MCMGENICSNVLVRSVMRHEVTTIAKFDVETGNEKCQSLKSTYTHAFFTVNDLYERC